MPTARMRTSTDPAGHPVPPEPPSDPPSGRVVTWLGRFGPVAVGYAVFQALVGLLPGALFGDTARYSLAVVSGLGTGISAWLAAALLRARGAADDGAADGPDGLPSPRRPRSGTASGTAGTDGPGPLPGLSAATYATLVERLTVSPATRRGARSCRTVTSSVSTSCS